MSVPQSPQQMFLMTTSEGWIFLRWYDTNFGLFHSALVLNAKPLKFSGTVDMISSENIEGHVFFATAPIFIAQPCPA